MEYTREGDQLNAECPEKFRDVLGHQFIAGLDDRGKVDLVQVYLGAKKSTVSYAEAKSAVEQAYQRFGESSRFDNFNDQPSSPPPTPALQSELVALLRLRISQVAPLSRDNLSYQPTSASANSRDQNGCLSFYRGIYCHNCRKKGHYSTSCPRPVVSGAQWDANRRAIDKLQRGSRQYPGRPGPVGPLLAPAVPASVASGGGDKEEQGGRKMNNIGGANVVILKRPIAKESHKSAPTQVSRPQDFWPTLRLTRLAVRSIEKPLVQQASQNLKRLSEKTARSSSLSPPAPEDDEMEDSIIIRADSYGMKGTLYLG